MQKWLVAMLSPCNSLLNFLISHISHTTINFSGKETLKDGTGSLSRSGSVDFVG